MAYDEKLAERVHASAGNIPLIEKKMFGGIGFMLHGNMACGIIEDMLIVRVGKENDEAALARPHSSVFDVTGRVMRGWVMVGPAGTTDKDSLSAWVDAGVKFALSLPPK